MIVFASRNWSPGTYFWVTDLVEDFHLYPHCILIAEGDAVGSSNDIDGIKYTD